MFILLVGDPYFTHSMGNVGISTEIQALKFFEGVKLSKSGEYKLSKNQYEWLLKFYKVMDAYSDKTPDSQNDP